MAAFIGLALIEGAPPWLEAFLALTAVVQTVLLAWLATVPRWGAKGARADRSTDREEATAGRRRRQVDG